MESARFNKRSLLIAISFLIVIFLGLGFLYLSKFKADTNGVVTQELSVNQIDLRAGQTVDIRTTLTTKASLLIEVRAQDNKLVKTLYMSKTPVGPISLVGPWDGQDSNNKPVATGTYKIISYAKNRYGTLIGKVTMSLQVKNEASGGGDPDIPNSDIVIKSITPNVINAVNSDKMTISYTLAKNGLYDIAVVNDSEAQIAVIGKDLALNAGSYTAYWTGKKSDGISADSGNYKINIKGTISTACNSIQTSGDFKVDNGGDDGGGGTGGEITISGEGQIIEGVGSANYNWLQDNETMFAVGFKAEKTGSIKAITIPWKVSGGSWATCSSPSCATTTSYGSGDRGIYTFQIVKADANKMPSSEVVATVQNVKSQDHDGDFPISISANLEAGKYYDLLIKNTHSIARYNFASPNTLMIRPRQWDGIGDLTNYTSAGTIGGWTPWSTRQNPWGDGTNYQNSAYTPVILTWGDNTMSGNLYYYSATSNRPPEISSSQSIGEEIKWTGSDKVVTKIKLSVMKQTAGTLVGHLESLDGTISETATMSDVNGSVPQWSMGTLSKPVTLRSGQTYRLWLSSSDGKYVTCIPYNDQWPQFTWGGQDSHPIYKTTGSWADGVPNNFVAARAGQADLTFDFE